MFLVRFFGFLDILAGMLLLLQLADMAPIRLLFGIVLYLGIKGYMYRGDLFSMIDLGVAVYVFIALFFPITFLSILSAAWLFFKGFYSLLS